MTPTGQAYLRHHPHPRRAMNEEPEHCMGCSEPGVHQVRDTDGQVKVACDMHRQMILDQGGHDLASEAAARRELDDIPEEIRTRRFEA